jgi:hypothetical protein
VAVPPLHPLDYMATPVLEVAGVLEAVLPLHPLDYMAMPVLQ